MSLSATTFGCLADVLAFVNDLETVPLWTASLGQDFAPPKSTEHAIYTTLDGSEFDTVVFGRVDVSGFQALRLECTEDYGLPLAKRFARQIATLITAMERDVADEIYAATDIHVCVDSDQPMTPYDGCLELQTGTVTGDRATVYARSVGAPLCAGVKIEAAKWVVAIASLRRYCTPNTNKVEYILFAKEMQVFELSETK
ncbi:hypothetical protein C8J57DRAFT_1540827 [Mycena rebaudengoi]|nr:hypothetical protein C8J57DRAFT_1540827 [Mycena rebaudengoi]